MTATDSSILVPLIAKLGLRASLDPVDSDMILALPCSVISFEPGAYPVRQGSFAEHCSVVLAGYVCRKKITGEGSRQILSIHLKGDLLDLQNLFLPEADCDAQALTATKVAIIPKQAMLELFGNSAVVRQALLLDMMADASISREWLLNVGQRSALERVAHLICEMALRQKMAGVCQGELYDWPLTQEQFGDAIGLTAVHINRMLKILRAEGIIAPSKRSLTIIDWPKLRRVADYSQGYLQQPYVF